MIGGEPAEITGEEFQTVMTESKQEKSQLMKIWKLQ